MFYVAAYYISFIIRNNEKLEKCKNKLQGSIDEEETPVTVLLFKYA